MMRGVYAIPPTPFHDDGAVDFPGLRNVIGFCHDAGAHGLVTPVNASEVTSLTDDERDAVLSCAAEANAGRIPLIAGVSGVSIPHAVRMTRHAVAVGADAVIAMPPYVRPATGAQIREYYARIAEAAAGRPVWIQNHMAPIGTPMSSQTLMDLLEIDGVEYVKEECLPPGHLMTQTMALAGGRLKGVMGGMAGRFLLDEHRRGSSGTMPACEITDVHVRLWDCLEAGDADGARDVFDAMLPLLNLEYLYGVAVYKEVLQRRGVIVSAAFREPGAVALDEYDRRELDAILDRLKPYFTAQP